MTDAQDDHWLMCLHEAAHAVVLAVEGGEPSWIQHSYHHGAVGTSSAVGMVRCALAGYTAETVARGETLDDLLSAVESDSFFGPDSDGALALDAVSKMRKTWPAQNRLLGRLADETIEIVVANWAAIESIARELSQALERDAEGGVSLFRRCGFRAGP